MGQTMKRPPGARVRKRTPETREHLIEAAAQLIQKEGYAAVTAGRLAEELGLSRHIVHYYFGTIEALLVAVMRRDGDTLIQRLQTALESADPLRTIWELGMSTSATVFELTALATRTRAIQAQVKRYTEEVRRIEGEALSRHLQAHGLQSKVSPRIAALIVQGVAQTLAKEALLGVSIDHAEAKSVVERWLHAFAEHGDAFALSPVSRRKSAK